MTQLNPLLLTLELQAIQVPFFLHMLFNDVLMMTQKRFGWRRLWPNQGTILALAWRDWGKPWTTSVSRACVLVKIQIEHLPNTSLECYLQTNCSVYGSSVNLFQNMWMPKIWKRNAEIKIFCMAMQQATWM
jgi:hypothetical protein